MDPDASQTEEPQGHEFGSYCFEDLQPAKVLEIVNTEVIEFNGGHSEDRENLLNSREVWEVKNVEFTETSRPQHQWQSQGCSSDFEEDSQNLRISMEERTFDLNYSKKLSIHRKLHDASESNESSRNLRKNACVQVTKHEEVKEIMLPLKPRQLQELQKNDMYCREVAKKLHREVELQKILIKEKEVLFRLWTENGRTFKCILVPKVLQDFMIILAHDHSGHNGSRRTYSCLKRQYYWPGIRKQVFQHCKQCKECVLQNQGQPEKGFSHFDSPELPMEFICMDLVGLIHPPSNRGNNMY